MSDSEDEHVYANTNANTNANARPGLTLKVRHVGGETREAELLLVERGEREDRGEREERIVDIYATADDLLQPAGSGTRQDAVSPRSAAPQQDAVSPRSAAPRQDAVSPWSAAPQQDAVSRSTPQQQHGGSGEPKNNGSRAAAVCLGLMCLLLSAGIIGLVVHNNYVVKHLDQTRQNLTDLKATFETTLEELHTRFTNTTQDKDKLQTSLGELHSRYTNETEQNAKLQNSLDELQSRYNDLKRRLCELPGWKKSVYGCYYVSTEWKTWDESRQYCKDRHSDLMIIKTKEEQDFVKGVNKKVWLGLTDRETKGRFKWVDGTPLTTPTFWNTGQPNNNGDGEDCVEFVNWPAKSKGWNERSCTNYNQWICESVIY